MREQYRLTKEIFIKRSNEIHGGKYSYDKVEYKNHRTKVIITCPIHGDFEQTPKNHMNGQGCPLCGKKYAKEWRKNDYKTFLKTSKERFGERYSFPHIKDEYENSHSKITVKCNKCNNEFIKIACDYITSPNGGCKHCYYSSSKPEEEIGEFITKIIGDEGYISYNNREIINNREIDIYIPHKRIGVEFNGLFWHKDKDKNYHLLKTEACNRLGIRLIQIFEDEYTFHKNIVLSKIKHILGCDYDLEKIYGRKCTINEINYKTASNFLIENHIQGASKSTIYIGAFYNDTLCGVMTFLKLNEGKWELTRFATDITKRSIGIGGKLFSFFVKKYNPKYIKSFADRRWTVDNENNFYRKLGFYLKETLKPDYKYYIDGEKIRIHKFNFRKKILSKKYNLPTELTESQMAEKIHAKRIYDCGLLKYVWENNN